MTKIATIGMRYHIKRWRARKLGKWEEFLVAENYYQSVSYRPFDILGLIIGVSTNMNRKVVVCGINLL